MLKGIAPFSFKHFNSDLYYLLGLLEVDIFSIE